MPTYRIFTIGRDQHFSGMPKIVECADDNEAVDNAMQLANGLDQRFGTINAWLRHSRVVRQKHRPP